MDEFYVCIDEPSEKRRVLLQSSRDLINSLKIVDDFVDFKTQKRDLFNELKYIMDEIIVLNNKIFGKLPDSSVQMPSQKIRKPSKLTFDSKRSKLDILENELADIENKLNSLE